MTTFNIKHLNALMTLCFESLWRSKSLRDIIRKVSDLLEKSSRQQNWTWSHVVRKATWIKLKRALFKKIFINHQILKKSIHFKAQNVAKKTSGTEERIKMKECKLVIYATKATFSSRRQSNCMSFTKLSLDSSWN